ncbi:MAG: uracil-DNA glycosylase [Clostridiales bacterium]|nr:uracil-DNA glycosylase [Clostridiales bacterium]
MDEMRLLLEGLKTKYPGKEFVLGEGDVCSHVMLIGEAPGEQEEKLHRPFVGKAGKNLDEMLALGGIPRSALYVTNTVKLRPTQPGKGGRVKNRPPTNAEISDFLPLLEAEIRQVAPRIIVTLGNTPLKALLGAKARIGDVHGTLIKYAGTDLYPMYHPASLIYTPSLKPVYEAEAARLGELMRELNIV